MQTEEVEGEVGRMFLQLAKQQFPGSSLNEGVVEEVLAACVARRTATSAEGDSQSQEVLSLLDFRDPCAYSVVSP